MSAFLSSSKYRVDFNYATKAVPMLESEIEITLFPNNLQTPLIKIYMGFEKNKNRQCLYQEILVTSVIFLGTQGYSSSKKWKKCLIYQNYLTCYLSVTQMYRTKLHEIEVYVLERLVNIWLRSGIV